MKYRKLRIAFSASCGILCLMLIVLWVRSYRFCDIAIAGCFAGHANILVNRGSVRLTTFPTAGKTSWRVQSLPPQNLSHGFHWPSFPSLRTVQIPIVMLVVFHITIGAIPWFPWSSFSLRTLLIGMTLVAVLLGIIAATMLRGS